MPTSNQLSLIPISQRFDFENDYWTKVFEQSLPRTFDRELELYELLDLDAEGKDLVGPDPASTQVLVS